MKQRLRHLRRDVRGLAAAEFAMLAPVFFALIIGITQVGILFEAQAGLRHAVQEGARYATIYIPTTTGTSQRPTNQQIIDKINASKYGLSGGTVTGPTITSGTATNTTSSGTTYTTTYLDITMSYQVPLNFIFYSTSPITLTETRRAWVQR
jgi:Flp pilus assembly protein TadG